MKKVLWAIGVLIFFSCTEALLQKPEDLIAPETMVMVLEDLSLLNAAKSTNLNLLRENELDPMNYIYSKYGIDSVRFSKSDVYYASIPEEYEKIYLKVEERLVARKTLFDKLKMEKDSLNLIELEAKRKQKEKLIDSLQQIEQH